MAKRVRVGMIGCGGIALHHAARLERVPEAEIVALADIDDGAIAKMRERFPKTRDLPAFRDYREMLDEVKLDAVEISTPHTLHFQQAMDALERNLHILVEKPMVCKVEHALRLIERAKEKDAIVSVSYQRHYQPPFRYMRNVIGSGRLRTAQRFRKPPSGHHTLDDGPCRGIRLRLHRQSGKPGGHKFRHKPQVRGWSPGERLHRGGCAPLVRGPNDLGNRGDLLLPKR